MFRLCFVSVPPKISSELRVALRPSSVKLAYCLHFTAVFNVSFFFTYDQIHYTMICFIKNYKYK